jgi:carbon monoxide dehydrogenase subunit G
MKIQRTVETPAAPAAVFAYLSDFTTTTEWDPGTVSTTRVSGAGDVGTEYRNVSRFLGRETELTYRVTEHTPDRRFALRGENKTVIAHDTMEIEPHGPGSRVTYTADFAFSGVAKVVAPLLAPALKKLGDEAEEGLQKALAQL